MSFHITSGTLGQAIAPLVFAPFVQLYGLSATPILMVPALAVFIVLLRRMPSVERLQERHEAGGCQRAPPVCATPDAALLHRRVADVDDDELRDVRAGDVDQARPVAGPGWLGGFRLSVCHRPGRLLRRPAPPTGLGRGE